MSEPLRVILYAAKSTVDKRGSIGQQFREAEAYARERGWTIAGRESDEAASAYSGNRGAGLERAMASAAELAKEHGRAGLVVWHSNRLARGGGDAPDAARHLGEYVFWAHRANVELHSVQDDHTFSNPILAVVMGEMAHQESKAKSAAVKRGMAGRRKRGLHTGGGIYGYVRDPETGLRPHPQQAATIRRIFELIAAGKSQAEVARILNRENVKPLRAKLWVQGSIAKVLRSRTYLGQIRGADGGWRPAAHEPLVSEELWNAANAQREAAAGLRGRRGGRRPKAGHLLPGRMLRHAACGSAMTPVTVDARADGSLSGRYVCSGRKAGVCEGLRVDMAAVDDAIIGHLAEVGIDARQTLNLVREATAAKRQSTVAELDAARRELAKAEAALERVRRDYLEGAITAADWAEFRPELETDRDASAGKVAQLEKRAAEIEREPEEFVPAAIEALDLIRAAIRGGDSSAVLGALETLFEGFLIGSLDEPIQAPTEALRDRVAALRREAESELDDSDALQLSNRLVIHPQPRDDAFAAICEEGRPVHLVDEHGRPIIRRLPLAVTNNQTLTM